MSRRIFLAAYKLVVKNARGQMMPLGPNIFRNGIQTRLTELTGYPYLNEESQRASRIENVYVEGEDIYGRIHGGSWGEKGYGENVESGRRSFTKEELDALHYPFFYHFSIPESGGMGWLITSKLGTYGVKTPLLESINQTPIFGENTKLHAFPIAPSRVLNSYLDNNTCVSVEFIKFQLDFGDNPANLEVIRKTKRGEEQFYGDDAGKISIKINPKRNISLKGLKEFFFKRDIFKPDRLGLIGFNEFEPDEVSAEFEYQGQTRKFYVRNNKKFSTYLDITDEVEKDGGHPTAESAILKSREFVRILVEEAQNE